MFILITIGAVLLSIILGPHETKPMKSVYTPPGFEQQETPRNVVDYTVKK